VIDFGDAPFMCIIGPNGAGKSNLMDAISFVLGVKSAQLRSTQLKDLVYRGRKAAEAEDGMEVDEETQETQTQDEASRTAFVIAVYEDDKGKEWNFKRSYVWILGGADDRINVAGASTYHLNSRAVPWNAYNQQLEKFNILVKAKNFLVFQGDVEGVASQDSKALAKLIDRISGYVHHTLPYKYDLLMLSSLDLAPQYEAAKLAQDKATDASNANFAKKRGMAAEVRHFEEQKSEYRQWEKLRNATVSFVAFVSGRADD
jgi:structural maintenance of chromosome 1